MPHLDAAVVAEALWASVGFVFKHWSEVLTIGTAVWLAIKGQSKKEAFNIALDAVRKMATSELDNPTKRSAAVSFVLVNLPKWAKPFVSETRVVDLVEDAWQKHVKLEK